VAFSVRLPIFGVMFTLFLCDEAFWASEGEKKKLRAFNVRTTLKALMLDYRPAFAKRFA
jgi:hypothetical protein